MRIRVMMALALAGWLLPSLAPLAARAAEPSVPPSEAALRYSFAPLVKRVSPAVVNVYASRVVKQRVSPFMDDPFFRQFFGGGGGGAPRTRIQQSLGSGVIIDKAGIVVTNYHVIANADEVKVALSDKRELAADIVLKDERMDLAVLRLKDATGPFPIVELADSDSVAVGDLVLAIGDPFGVGQTVTSGIVSALARTQVGATDYQFYIQTDAAINPGNSGGALVDMNGRLVGINTAIYSRSGGSIGIGFAIPSNMVRVIAKAALSDGKVHLPWIGAEFQQVTPDLADGLGLDRPHGALVAGVTEGSPAEKAGLTAGDLVVSADGIDIDDPNGLNYRLVTKGIGASVELGLLRGGKPANATIVLAAAPEIPPRDEMMLKSESPFQGATVVNLSPAVIADTGYKGRRSKGVLIEKVDDGSIAASVGFQAGDIVVEVNGQAVDATRTLASVTATPADLWRLTIERDGRLIRSTIGG
ncbi:DegQ family serine endoprotease [Mesorhizobium sp. BR1-1-16]|uniref:DegQ family serine endoprotease n=1 Tax=Mesorhizobium sp. BR1-1-16 TaxID=2876653 RepID=UPI001CCF717F|nr:DegQ family serine endoprotease [Mesorhizobium sp. BR1-1-16]MBZ9938282.1 DegQ family serine endoprotease [Mesorhizobium sp. BR1-1-16]